MYIIIERFRDGKTNEIYQRLEQKGRMIPEGLYYIDSWVTKNGRICFQLMETDDPATLTRWTENWRDLVEFEIHPVIASTNFQQLVKTKIQPG